MQLRAKAPGDWTADVLARLEQRLEPGLSAPLVVAFSGGGDSLALLHLTLGWAREHGRRVLALTVDHDLHPDSAIWTSRARDMALAAGAEWRGLRWTGAKPLTGLPAAARRVRHALLAEAARDAGAVTVLMGHTRDDLAEAASMRASGSTVGDPREWGPSPVWPEGRDVALLRPLLGVGRAELRDWLNDRGLSWLDDPANTDARFARARARAAGDGEVGEPPEPRPCAAATVSEWGEVTLDRDVDQRVLAAACACASGVERPARGPRVASLRTRLGCGDDLIATLGGSRIEARGASIRVTREVGDFRRSQASPVRLAPGAWTVWDGRWALRADEEGWRVTSAAGMRSRLPREDRLRLAALSVSARGSAPVLMRDAGGDPILATPGESVCCLVGDRLARALDTWSHEREWAQRAHGALDALPLS